MVESSEKFECSSLAIGPMARPRVCPEQDVTPLPVSYTSSFASFHFCVPFEKSGIAFGNFLSS